MKNPFEPPQFIEDDDDRQDATDEPTIRVKNIEGAVYSVHTLLIATVAFAGCGGVAVFAPGVGISMMVIASIILIRMVLLDAWRRAKNEPPDLPTKILLFISSFGLVVVVGVAAAIAFVAVCYPVGAIGAAALQNFAYGLPGVLIGIVCGIITVIVVLYFAYTKYFWNRW